MENEAANISSYLNMSGVGTDKPLVDSDGMCTQGIVAVVFLINL